MTSHNEMIEALSAKVHEAWMQEKEAQGFVYGPDTCNVKKTHSDMLPYEELPENIKEYDRVTVRSVLKALTELGFEVTRKLATWRIP